MDVINNAMREEATGADFARALFPLVCSVLNCNAFFSFRFYH